MVGRLEVRTPAELAAGLAGLVAMRPAPGSGPRLVAVDGLSGSGKTHLAGLLAPAFGAPCVHLDDFVPGWQGLAESVDLLIEWVLAPLAAGASAEWRHWDWEAAGWGRTETLAPSPLVVIEGCGAGAAAVRPWLSALVWLDISHEQRTRRLRSRPDWATYEPWARVWADQEAALYAGDDPVIAADALVRAGTEEEVLELRWQDR